MDVSSDPLHRNTNGSDPLSRDRLKTDQTNSDQINIDTPELVSIEMPLAGIGSRFIATLIDTIIWVLASLLLDWALKIILPAISAFSQLSAQWTIALYTFATFLLFWGYFTLFEAFWNGRTPGKKIAKIRVIQRSGRSIGLIESMARNLIRIIDMQPLTLYAVGVISMFVTKQHQRLGDLAAGTLVVRDREPETPLWGESSSRTFTAQIFASAAIPEPHHAVTLPALGIGKLAASDLEVLESFFSRRLDMSLDTRRLLAGRIAAAIQAKSGLEIPEGASVETFLEATARQLRDQARMQ
jgi:uncharacterized RDD family membrane protein YckC